MCPSSFSFYFNFTEKGISQLLALDLSLMPMKMMRMVLSKRLSNEIAEKSLVMTLWFLHLLPLLLLATTSAVEEVRSQAC